jgi:hypothetical protein
MSVNMYLPGAGDGKSRVFNIRRSMLDVRLRLSTVSQPSRERTFHYQPYQITASSRSPPPRRS